MRKKNLIKRSLVYALTGSMLFSNISPAFAYTYKDSIANVEYTDVIENATNNTTVYAEVGSFFKVSIPKHIILDGTTKSGAYTVGVVGDIAGTETVNVVPDKSFALKSNFLKDVTASIEQDKTSWTYNEMLEDNASIGNGAIDAKDITAGSWNGNFNFNINLENSIASENEKVEISFDDETTKEITIDAGDNAQIDVFLDGENVSDEATWTSDNENVTVDNGLVEVLDTAQDGEIANITAEIDDKSITIKITVNKEKESPLTLSMDEVTMGAGDSTQVIAYFNGEDVTNEVEWNSNNENITVNNGLIETKASAQIGETATITVTAENPENVVMMANLFSDAEPATIAETDDKIEIELAVTVIDMEFKSNDEIITSVDLKAGGSQQIEVTIIPSSVSGLVTWTSTANSGINLVKYGNKVTIKIADDMPAGSSYNVIASYGDFSKLLKINIISDHVHNYVKEITKEATCTEVGIITYTCECKHTYTEEIPVDSDAHNYESNWTTILEPTCTEAGRKVQYCSNCTYALNEEEIPATGHSYETEVTSPTCTEEGYTTYTCSVCNNTYISDKVSATNHTEVIDSAISATCTETGLTEGKHCSVCNEVLVAQEVVAATGHDYVSSVTKEATCTEEGNTHYECNNCDSAYDEVINATGHIYDSTKYVTDVAATCSTEGSKSVHCNVCSAKITGTEVTIPATGHNYNDTYTIVKEATCAESGVEQRTCINEGCENTEIREIPKLKEHDYKDLTTGEINNWTNTSNGTYAFIQDDTKWMSNNKNINSSTATSTWTIELSEETEYSLKYKVSSETSYDKLTITLDNTTVANAISGAGSEETYTTTLSAGTHTIVATYTKDNSSNSNDDCGYIILEPVSTIISIHKCAICGNEEEHDYQITINSEATCEKPGLKTFTCKCGIHTEEIPATGHKFTNGICEYCQVEQPAGLYDANGVMLCTWEESGIDIETDYTNYNFTTETTSANYVLTNVYPETTQVVVPSNVTRFGYCAFTNCKNLTNVNIPYGVTELGGYAFSGCSNLSNIDIPNTVKTISYSVFSMCDSLTSLTIPDSVTSLGEGAIYSNYKLESLYIGSGLTEKIDNAIHGNISLKTIVVDPDNTTYDSRNNCNAIIETKTNTLAKGCKETIIPNTVTSIGDYAFYYENFTSVGTAGSGADLEIPNTITSIGSHAFANCSQLISVNLPSKITNIGASAFYGCSRITNLTIPNNVTTIGNSAFSGCSGLTSITIPSSVTSIGSSAFNGCRNLTSITIPSSVNEIGAGCFRYCSKLETAVINAKSIGANAFNGVTSLKNLTLGNTVTTILNHAFSGCTGLTSITLPSSITTMDTGVFTNCTGSITINCNVPVGALKSSKFTKVIVNSGVTTIGNSAFSGCTTITDLTLPSTLTTIEYSAFMGCTGLTNITLPNKVTTIGNNAFANCTGLTSITLPNSITTMGTTIFNGCTGSIIINCNIPSASSSSYSPFKGSKFSSVTFGSNVTSIGNYAFYLSSITNVTIPSSMTNIGIGAFGSCSSLTSATFKDTTTWYVGTSAGAATTKVDVTNVSTNATYLKSTHQYKYWTKK